ncbi:MAG: hypothetical protein KJO79_02465, partial [Verrucomicrobiae bacterium]|nr:hypothetical protein [Verrucomicrobiae bacterium]NNJ86018.1 hypothetical protein [Akkermansiaceae bacterium]
DRLKEFRAALESPDVEEALKRGAIYDRGIKGVNWVGEKGFTTLVPSTSGGNRRFLKQVASRPDQPYAKAAAAQLKAHPEILKRAGNALVTLKVKPEHQAGKTHTLTADFEVQDLTKINDLYLSFIMAKALKVQLNGTVIMDNTMQREDARTVNLLLKPITRELLKAGKNTLSIELNPAGKNCEVSLKTSQ